MKNILKFELFLEMMKIQTSISGTGLTKTFDIIFDTLDNPKALAHSVALKDKLRKLEVASLMGIVVNERDLEALNKKIGFIDKLKLPKDQEKFIQKLKIALNNQKFLYSELEKGPLNCKYCKKKNLKIYDFTKNKIFNKKDGATCDHVIPISKGGDQFDFSNMVVACYYCNKRKSDKLPNEWAKETGKKFESFEVLPDSDLVDIESHISKRERSILKSKVFGEEEKPGFFNFFRKNRISEEQRWFRDHWFSQFSIKREDYQYFVRFIFKTKIGPTTYQGQVHTVVVDDYKLLTELIRTMWMLYNCDFDRLTYYLPNTDIVKSHEFRKFIIDCLNFTESKIRNYHTWSPSGENVISSYARPSDVIELISTY